VERLGAGRCNATTMALRALAVAAFASVVVFLAPAAARSPHTGHQATCARQSGASFPNAYTSRANRVVGPLSMIGAGRYTSQATVDRFGGNKFPVLVRAGHTVTLELSWRANRSASLFYAVGGGGVLTETRVRDGRRVVTFRSCSARRAISDADGAPVTFWSGFVVVSRPTCVRLKVWIDAAPSPRRAHVALGRRC
jgi:hypothetical protein